jgi:hypothetical protein
MINIAFYTGFLLMSLTLSAHGNTGDKETSKIYFLLTGKPLSLRHPERSRWIQLVEENNKIEAAREMTKDSSFINQTVLQWAIRYLSYEKETAMVLNDALAMVVGIVKDNIDARLFLSGNFSYGPNQRLGYRQPSPSSNAPYALLESRSLDLSTNLQKYTPQWDVFFKDNAGLLTTRYWGEKYYFAGTNRRPVVGLMNVFMCQPIENWKTANLSTSRIRQDIPRDPSNDPRLFQQECRSCHGPMDALAGAFAYLDFEKKTIIYSYDVAKKYTHNDHTYPEGYATKDDSWKNLLTARNDLGLDWKGPNSGKGVKELGQLVTNSEGFGRCLVKRSLSFFCDQQLSLTDPWVIELTDTLKQSGYNLKDLFINIATSKKCL